jgi:hypothetical protein
MIWRLMALELWLGFLDGGELAQPSQANPEIVAAVSS